VSVELHLPDLPEVPISLGPARAAPSRVITPWHLRLRDALTSYLPLLLMAALALATWWLVKNSPRPVQATAERPVSSEPDYTMTQFAVERFDKTGRLKLRIEGAQMRHFPDTDRLEIEEAQIRAFAPDGRMTLATAKRALGNGDGSEIQLLGGAEVTTQDEVHGPLVMQGEFLHAYLLKERVVTHLPVLVRHGGTEMQAAGLQYDHVTRRLDLKGPLRMVLAPKGSPALKAGKQAAKP
jgi:lipopolysaccharide export system protein LptC